MRQQGQAEADRDDRRELSQEVRRRILGLRMPIELACATKILRSCARVETDVFHANPTQCVQHSAACRIKSISRRRREYRIYMPARASSLNEQVAADRLALRQAKASARSVALVRLGNYANGGNRGSAELRLARPLVQAEEGAGRWTNPRRLAVRERRYPRQRDSETLAIFRVPGRPAPLAIRHAETAIRQAGGVMLRLHAPIAVLPFRGRFEVALPVVERTPASATSASMFDTQAKRETATQSTPQVRGSKTPRPTTHSVVSATLADSAVQAYVGPPR